MTMKPPSALKTLALAGLASALLAGQAGAQTTRPASAPVPAPAPSTTPVATSGRIAPARAVTSSRSWFDQEYRLGPGDKLRVEVYREPQLSQALQVRPDGKITLPLIGDIGAAGVTSN